MAKRKIDYWSEIGKEMKKNVNDVEEDGKFTNVI